MERRRGLANKQTHTQSSRGREPVCTNEVSLWKKTSISNSSRLAGFFFFVRFCLAAAFLLNLQRTGLNVKIPVRQKKCSHLKIKECVRKTVWATAPFLSLLKWKARLNGQKRRGLRPLLALRCVSKATRTISSFVTSSRTSVRSVLVNSICMTGQECKRAPRLTSTLTDKHRNDLELD